MSSFSSSAAVEWNPEVPRARNPSGQALKRIYRDINSLRKDPLPGIYFVPDEKNNCLGYLLLIGPLDTPYEGGFFFFMLAFPDDYPFSPPQVKILNTGGGTVRFNPNLYANGKVCLSILGTWSGPSWR